MRMIDADELIRNLEGIISDYTSRGMEKSSDSWKACRYPLNAAARTAEGGQING